MTCEPCTDCQRYTSSPSWRQCDPACLECGGRYLRLIQKLQIPSEDKRTRLRAALKARRSVQKLSS